MLTLILRLVVGRRTANGQRWEVGKVRLFLLIDKFFV